MLEREYEDVRMTASEYVANSAVSLNKMSAHATRDAATLFNLRELLDGRSPYASISREAGLLARMRQLKSGAGNFDFFECLVAMEGGVFDRSRYHADLQPREKRIDTFSMADFPVTNELFEVFCPSHRRQRDGEYSLADDQPVVHVNWYMAVEFCRWLSELTGDSYRLPTEWEWEWACRWRDTCTKTYWWGDEMRDDLCWYRDTSNDMGTRGRGDTMSVFGGADLRHPSWAVSDASWPARSFRQCLGVVLQRIRSVAGSRLGFFSCFAWWPVGQ